MITLLGSDTNSMEGLTPFLVESDTNSMEGLTPFLVESDTMERRTHPFINKIMPIIFCKFMIMIYLLAGITLPGFADDLIIDNTMVIQGEQKKRIKSEKLPIRHEFNIDKVLTFDMEPVKDIYHYYASRPEDDQYVRIPEYKPIDILQDVKVVDILSGPYIKHFNPENFAKARAWMLTILDVEGRAVRTFTSFDYKGKDGVYWDGFDSRGIMLNIGYPYSTMFEWTAKKAARNPDGTIEWPGSGLYKQTEIGESFTVDALFYRSDNACYIQLTHEALFTDDDTINDSMANQAAVLIKEHFNGTISINVHAAARKQAAEQAEQLKTVLMEKLFLTDDRFSVQGVAVEDNRPIVQIILN